MKTLNLLILLLCGSLCGMTAAAQGVLTGLQVSRGIVAERHPVSVGNQTLQINSEKNISFSIRNIGSQPITRALRLYVSAQPGGSPQIVWDSVITFGPSQTVALSRSVNGRLGSRVTLPVGNYRLELRGNNTNNLTTVTPLSPLVPGVSGVSSVNMRVISDECQASVALRVTTGIVSAAHPVSFGPDRWQRNREKNINFSLKNFSNGAVISSVKLYLVPVNPPGAPVMLWQGTVSLGAGQTRSFSRGTHPELGYLVTEPQGVYQLELRGSDITDLAQITPACPLIAGGRNPAPVFIGDCAVPFTVNVTPPGPVNLCPGTGITLTATPDPLFSYQWRRNGVNLPGAVAQTYVTGSAGSYDVSVTKAGCPLPALSNAVTVNLFNVNPFIGNLNSVYGSLDPIVAMTGNPAGGTFTGPGVVGNTFNPQTAGVGTHTVTYSGTDANGCAYNVVRDVTVVQCFASVAITPAPTVLRCPGGNVTFTATVLAGYSYQWLQNGNVINGAVNTTYTATTAGTYSVRATKAGCPVLTSNASVFSFFPAPVPSITDLNATYTTLDPIVNMTGSPAGGTFSGPGVVGNNFNPQIAGPGTHLITYAGNDGNGCPYSVNRTVTVISCIGSVAITPAPTVQRCPGGNVTFTATVLAGYTYQWLQNGNVINGAVNTTYTATTAGTYSVRATKAGCPVLTSNVSVFSFFPAPAPSITGLNATYTTLDPIVNMTGSPAGGTFSGPGVVGNNFNPQIAGPGTHLITYAGNDGNGCPYSVSRTVTVISCIGSVAITPAPTVQRCPGGTVTFTATVLAGYSYEWLQNGNVINGAVNTTYTATTAGTYSVRATKPGCPVLTSNASVFSFFPQTNATISGLNAQYFDHQSPVTMAGNPAGGTFTGPGVVGNTFSPQVAGVGIHMIIYAGTDANGCPYSTTATVEVIEDPCHEPVYWKGESAILHEHFWDVIDINNDGKRDVLTCKYGANPGKWSILFNNGVGLDPPVSFNVDRNINGRTINDWHGRGSQQHYQDFDGDGIKDMLLSFSDMGSCSYSSFRVYWGIGAYPYFDALSYTTIWTGGNCTSGWGIDYDGDGDKDIFLESAFGVDMVFRNNGNRTFTFIANANHPRDTNYLIQDWDGDGKEDLLAGNHGFNGGGWGVIFYKSNGDGSFAPGLVHHAAQQLYMAHRIQADPLNNSQIDVMSVSAADTRNLFIGTWNNGLSNFTFTSQTVLAPNTELLNAFDYNGDGYQDIISRQYGGPERVFVNYNNGNGNFAVREQIFESSQSYPMFVDNLGTDCHLIFVKKTANDSILILNARPGGIRFYRQTEVKNEIGQTQLHLYPNPAKEAVRLTFTVETGTPAEAALTDMSGRNLKKFRFQTVEGYNEHSFGTEDLSAGLYLLKVKIGSTEQILKLAIE